MNPNLKSLHHSPSTSSAPNDEPSWTVVLSTLESTTILSSPLSIHSPPSPSSAPTSPMSWHPHGRRPAPRPKQYSRHYFSGGDHRCKIGSIIRPSFTNAVWRSRRGGNPPFLISRAPMRSQMQIIGDWSESFFLDVHRRPIFEEKEDSFWSNA